MIKGHNYLVHAGDWHTYVATFVEQVSPLLYGFRNVSKVATTNNNDNWHELIADENGSRKTATFIHYPDIEGDLYQLPISIIAMPWKGLTPQEAEQEAEEEKQ